MQKEENGPMNIPATLFANLQRVFRCLGFGRSLKAKSPTLSVAQMRILSFFNEQDVVYISEISRALDMSLQSVNNLVHRLETMGHVERTKNSIDKRVSDIRLTDKGRIGFQAFRDDQLEVISEILSGIEPAEQRLLAASVETAALILEKAMAKENSDKA
jgi:DNA-binding MarR family transcriptional regulator